MSEAIQQRENRADPTADLDRAIDDLHAGLSEVFDFWPFAGRWVSQRGPGGPALARTDVRDTGKSFRIVAEVPGIPKEKVEIRVRGATVEIRAEQATDATEPDGAFVHRERHYAGYFRTLELPEPVVAADAKAKVENGLLELELPKLHPSPSNDEVKVAVD